MLALPETTAPPNGFADAVLWATTGMSTETSTRRTVAALIVIFFFLFNGLLAQTVIKEARIAVISHPLIPLFFAHLPEQVNLKPRINLILKTWPSTFYSGISRLQMS